MNSIFILSFLFIMIASLLIDRKVLKQQKGSVKVTYGLITFVTFALFMTKYLHVPIPMPSRFFIHTVSPWFSHLMGI
ncbi:DMSO/TMAO reductase YedYZ heme-binding membrane subunit [Paenibacillus sp. V4I3]|uniref:hypothetical protein n=1 Tax=unclassified Paenibacillus TaxID=185978 RepID=UPI00277F234F|nr:MULTISPECIES: hypothetical protein [unclassified Paenibacillus]MDQ0873093.1 DMSO/TMAO reductase YedYZ heme-binding membrane subunit [Paenibacillus sp. V4I3]MDQ0890989.1 DMSO/TMAO reductase YedYZ heme-binding membrane subunit [Paenibacillus sp. V4I9]